MGAGVELRFYVIGGGYHISNQECKVFREKRVCRAGEGNWKKAESAPIIHVRNAKYVLAKRNTKANPAPPPQKFVCYRSITFVSSFRQMKAFVASPRKPPPQLPNPHVNSRRGGDRRRNHFSLIAIVHRALRKISTA